MEATDLVAFCLKHQHQLRSLTILVDHVAQKVLRPFDDSTNTLFLELKGAADVFNETRSRLCWYKEKTKDFARRTLYDVRRPDGFIDFAPAQTSQARELQGHFENVLESFDKVLDILAEVKARAAHGKKDDESELCYLVIGKRQNYNS